MDCAFSFRYGFLNLKNNFTVSDNFTFSIILSFCEGIGGWKKVWLFNIDFKIFTETVKIALSHRNVEPFSQVTERRSSGSILWMIHTLCSFKMELSGTSSTMASMTFEYLTNGI